MIKLGLSCITLVGGFAFSQCLDVINPTASNPSAISVDCIGDVPAPDPLVVTTEADNSGVAPVVAFVSDVSDGNWCPEVITRTYSVSDTCSNTINVSQSIIVDDNINPTATNPAPIFVDCISDYPTINTAVVTTESDNCFSPSVSWITDLSDGNTCNGEIITRTYGVTDQCGNTMNVTQLIHFSASTPLIDAGVDQSVCEGEEVTLTASNPDGASISWNNGVIDGLPFTPTVGTTSYTVTGSICGGECLSSDIVNVTVDCFVSIDEQEETIRLFPNPTTDKLIIELPSFLQTSVEIANLNGQILVSRNLSDTKEEIDLSELPDGTYFVRLVNENGVSLFKILKN